MTTTGDRMTYTIRRVRAQPEFRGEWDGAAWGHANVLETAHFHAKSSDHRPRTHAKVLYDDSGIYVLIRVADRYVKSVETHHQGRVWLDSCVEFFVQPTANNYFNIEVNCGGAILMYSMPIPPRGPDGKFAGHRVLTPDELAMIRVYHSMPKATPIEIAGPVEWCVEYFVPNALLERYVGPLDSPAQRRWRGNFYKCGDDTSHPHWASWNPIERFDFHQPECFAPLVFET
jgi:hypothetical protein